MSADHSRTLSALHAIPSDSSHDEWVRVVMAAKAAGLFFEEVDAWSSSGATYKEQAMRSTWHSTKPDKGIGAGTLFYIAKQHGWHGGINGAAPAKPVRAVERASKPHSTSPPREGPDEVWARCVPATHRHSYIVRKGVDSIPLDDLRVVPEGDPLWIDDVSVAGALAMRVRRSNGSTSTLQFILPVEVAERRKAQGKPDKLNLSGFPVDGWFSVGEIALGGTIYVNEGFGGACSCWKASDAASVACCGSGRMRTVATQLRQRDPESLLVLVSDRGKEKDCDAIAREVGARVVHMPEDEAQNFDANDFALREGHDALADLLERAREPVFPESPDGVVLTKASDIAIKAVLWLWKFWLALGKLILLAGAPGQGKTTLALAITATVSSGGRWPDDSRCDAGNVLIWSGEDDPGDTLAPRLKAMDANMDNVHFVSGSLIDGKAAPFDPASDMPNLLASAERLGNVRLIVVDPIVSAIAGDSHKNAEVRHDLQPLVDMASALGATVLGITHLSKGTAGRDPTERVTGSIAFSAVARIVLLAARVKGGDGNDRRILMRSKSNIGPDSGGFEYHVEQSEVQPGVQASVVKWGEAVEGTARELMAEAEAEPNRNTVAADEATECLARILGRDTVPSDAAKAQMEDEGFSAKMIRTARERLGIKPTRSGFGKEMRSYWKLPDPSLMPSEAIDAHCCPLSDRATMVTNEEARVRLDARRTHHEEREGTTQEIVRSPGAEPVDMPAEHPRGVEL